MDTTLIEATVMAGGRTARRVRVTGFGVKAPGAVYRLRGEVVLPQGGREIGLADTILLALSRLGEATRPQALREAGADHGSGERVFAALVRGGLVVRVGTAKRVHPGALRRLSLRRHVVLCGTVRRVSGSHPAKRRVHLDLSDGRRAEVRCYGAAAVAASRLAPGTPLRVTGVELAGRRLQVRATGLSVVT